MTGGMALLAYAKKDMDLLNQRIADLERELAETQQYLAVAEGQADGGPPGWTMEDGRGPYTNMWCRDEGPDAVFGVMIAREDSCGRWFWRVWPLEVENGVQKSGSALTAREAMAAAEAAYQRAIKGE